MKKLVFLIAGAGILSAAAIAFVRPRTPEGVTFLVFLCVAVLILTIGAVALVRRMLGGSNTAKPKRKGKKR